jgi:hypothetical protein
MMRGVPLDDDARAFFTAVEEHFIRRRGQALLLSPADVGRVAGWHRDGVPLEAVREGIDIHFDRLARRGRAPRRAVTLAFLEDDVLDAWAGAKRRRLGRAAAASAGGEADDGEPASLARPEEHAHLVAALEAATSTARARGLPEAAVAAIAAATEKLRAKAGLFEPGRPEHDEQRTEDHLRRLEKSLQEALQRALGEERVAALRREAEAELGERRQRMAADAAERVTAQLLARRVRDACAVPRLSLFYT